MDLCWSHYSHHFNLPRQKAMKHLSKVADHLVKVCDMLKARSNYLNTSLPLPSPDCSLSILLFVHTVIKNLIIDVTELSMEKAEAIKHQRTTTTQASTSCSWWFMEDHKIYYPIYSVVRRVMLGRWT